MKKAMTFEEKEAIINKWYEEELEKLNEIYDDADLVNFQEDIDRGDYITAFKKTVKLGEKRNVGDSLIRSKADADRYFMG